MPDPKDVVSRAMPGWQIVDESATASRETDDARSPVDRVAVEFPETRATYRSLLGSSLALGPARPKSDAINSGPHADFVHARPKNQFDAAAGEKTFLVIGDRIVGAQG